MTPTTTATPIAIRPSCRSLMCEDPVRASGRFPDAERLLDVHGHHARHALLGHRHADELGGDLHRDLVVADEQELGLVGHLADEAAESLGVGVVAVGLPGGCARTSIPASRISSPVISSRASPPPKSVGKSWPKWRFACSNV